MWQRWLCKSIRRSITQIDALRDMRDPPHWGRRLTSHLPSFPINPDLGAQTPTTSMSPLLPFYVNLFLYMYLTASQLLLYTSTSSIWLRVH